MGIRIYLLLFFILTSFSGYTATVKGVLNDKSTREPIISAVVVLNGTSYNTSSGLDGSFVIRNVPAGNYTITIKYLGYKTFTQDINIAEGNTEISVPVDIEQESTSLDEVVVEGSEDKTTDESAIRSVQNSERVMNIVSAKSIQISPDITVANVIQRVSGISIERNSNGDGQHAIIRGMDKRYNYTLVNGVKIPSPDDKYRYVPLDIFPAELLDRLEITKSLTPNMEGDAVGGVINMVMKDAPATKYLNANIATGYSELFMQRNFLSYQHNNINFQSPYESYGKNYNATVGDFPTDRVKYTSSHAPLNLIGGLAIGNRFFNSKLGVMVAGSYQNTFRGSNSLFFNTNLDADDQSYYLTTQNERQYSEEQERYGLHTKLDYKLSPGHKLKFYGAYLNLTNIQTRDVKSIGLSNGYEPEKGNANLDYSTRTRLTQQSILNGTLQGEHTLSKKLKAQWSGVYSVATNEVPDNTTVDLYGARTNFVDTRTTVSSETRSWQHNSDRDLAMYLNLTYSIYTGPNLLELSTGGLVRNKERSNFYNSYQFNPVNTNATYGADFTDYTQIAWKIQNPRGSYANALTYDASEDIAAGYLQFKYKLPQIDITGGVRVENTNQGYNLKFPIGEDRPNGNQAYTDILPSINIKYSPWTKINWRASYFRSINRPGFFEIVPFKQVFEEYTEKGNPDLKRAVVDNFDLRYEFFPHSQDQILIGAFYKLLHDPIEYTIQADAVRGQDQYFTPGNFGTAVNYGLELDVIKYFRWFGIKANYTYTNSSITTPKDVRIRETDGSLATVQKDQTRPLYGQSAHIGNLSFLIKDAKSGIDAQLAASYTGDRINTVSQYYDNDLWQAGFVQMDASIEKTFKKHFTIFLKANNLLNTPLTIYLKNTNPKNGDVPDVTLDGNKTLVRKDYYQRSYMAGFRFKL